MKMVSATDVFEEGKYKNLRKLTPKLNVEFLTAKKTVEIDMLVLSPTTSGTYSVLLFLHGFMLQKDSYTRILQHISSHGYIVVAPQLYHSMFFGGKTELDLAAEVANWISTDLQYIENLPAGVRVNAQSLALAGHSRGGKTAFALALGHARFTKLIQKPSVLIGLDPVGGSEPHVLTTIPQSFDLDIHVTVIGMGLGSKHKFNVLPPCAPKGSNHDEFYLESKPPCTHIVAKDYGHMDMIDDDCDLVQCGMCESGTGDKNSLQKCLGGIFVAVLRASLQGKSDDLNAIVNRKVVPPVTLDPINVDHNQDNLNIKARL